MMTTSSYNGDSSNSRIVLIVVNDSGIVNIVNNASHCFSNSQPQYILPHNSCILPVKITPVVSVNNNCTYSTINNLSVTTQPTNNLNGNFNYDYNQHDQILESDMIQDKNTCSGDCTSDCSSCSWQDIKTEPGTMTMKENDAFLENNIDDDCDSISLNDEIDMELHNLELADENGGDLGNASWAKCIKENKTLYKILTTNTKLGDKAYQCPYCQKIFKAKGSLHTHYRKHTRYSFKCNYCDFTFARKKFLLEHLNRHLHIKPYVCKFPGCGKQFTQNHSLKHHEKTHTQIKRYCCAVATCNKKFRLRSELKKHMKTHQKSSI